MSEFILSTTVPRRGVITNERFRSVVDVHLVLVRGDQLLLTRRANTGYAATWTDDAIKPKWLDWKPDPTVMVALQPND